jgi:hypothetical protein
MELDMNDHIIALRRRATEIVNWLTGDAGTLDQRQKARLEFHSINEELKTMGLRVVLSLREIKNAKA